jgi:uncharacterized membrane protein YgdD (TMEM256/DUF423 family)
VRSACWCSRSRSTAASATPAPAGSSSIGTLIFALSLYALALSGVKILGAITPIGGAAMIAAWLWIALQAIRR